ncbi:hypothetical protein [Staphylococcus simulans]|uniref:hypothetical protein n=1 Tax=Staphylococcus simulans TaxID=1286 RepID=UPI0021D06D68|nr:hypothetical protein [Staphylococcus simulans]UXR51026.1 hypothetical protein MUA28_05640 [Staphylococcus simulans]
MMRHIHGSEWNRSENLGLNDNMIQLFNDTGTVKKSLINLETSYTQKATEDSLKFDYLYSGVEKVNQITQEATSALQEAQRINSENIAANQRIDNIIAESGTSDTEVVDARASYTTLNERLNSQDAIREYNENKGREISYMNFLNENSAIADGNTLEILGDRDLKAKLKINESESYTLQFTKDTNDDFIKFRNVDLTTNKSSTQYKSFATTMLTGSSVSGGGDNIYVTDTASVITYNFTGSGIAFRYYTDTRGGIWDAYIDGQKVSSFSTHLDAQSSSTLIQSSIGEAVIATNLQQGPHKLELKFVGADPANPPSSSPARGWIKQNSTSGTDTRTETFRITVDESQNINVLYDSNKEFAFDVDDAGNRAWIPEHNSTGTLKLGTKGTQKLILDNSEVSMNVASTAKTFKEMKILQDLYGFMPNTTEPVCRVLIVATITSRGVKFNTTWTWYKSVTVRNGYVNMFTVNPAFANRIVSSNRQNYNIKIFDNSYEYIAEKAPYSYAALSTDFDSYYATVDNINPYETLRLGSSTRDGDEWGANLFAIQHRNEYLQKLYPKTYTNHVTQPNEVYRFEGYFGFGKLPLVNGLL